MQTATSNGAIKFPKNFSLDAMQGMDEAFPAVDPGVKPAGNRILVQVRSPKTKTASGLYLPDEAKDTEKWNVQVGKVVGVGPLAFRDRDTLKEWGEGAYCKEGDFIRFPKFNGDRFEVPVPGKDGESALFIFITDHMVLGVITDDPRAMKAYI